MIAWGRWRVVWGWMRRRLSAGSAPGDIEQARRQRREAEYELAHARNQRARVDQAYARMRRSQQEVDFTALVEQTFASRRN